MSGRTLDFEVLAADGSRLHSGEFWPSVGVSVAMENGLERNEVESAVNFLAADSAAVSASLASGLSVVIAKRRKAEPK